jgi:hypothetical protein
MKSLNFKNMLTNFLKLSMQRKESGTPVFNQIINLYKANNAWPTKSASSLAVHYPSSNSLSQVGQFLDA